MSAEHRPVFHANEPDAYTCSCGQWPCPDLDRWTKRQERRRAKNEAREARYHKGKSAEAEVLRRLTLALDRINVASQGRGGNPAQYLHAIHYLQRGWTGSFSPENDSRSVPREAPYFSLGDTEAEELALGIHRMFVLAYNATVTVDEADR